jgi:inhibitor of KinA sporulation pathway (predicted exonuclease)
LLVFDIETTDPREDGPPAIIEIGAVMLGGDLEQLGRFQSFVFPGRPVSDRILELTAINKEDLERADGWLVVAQRFENWVSSYRNPQKVRLTTWGMYDVGCLRQHYEGYERPYPFAGSSLDVKTAATMWCALSGQRTDPLGLAKAAEYLGLKWTGVQHRALADAEMTAAVFRKVMEDVGGGVWLNKQYVKVSF